VANGLGDYLDDPSEEAMRRFLNAIDTSDEEHGAAWLSTDSDYTLEWSDAVLVFSGPGFDPPSRHMRKVPRERCDEHGRTPAVTARHRREGRRNTETGRSAPRTCAAVRRRSWRKSPGAAVESRVRWLDRAVRVGARLRRLRRPGQGALRLKASPRWRSRSAE
jgi:hypothetical protein